MSNPMRQPLAVKGSGSFLVFLHIPKTGGLTLYWILNRQYKKHEIFTLNWSKNFDLALDDFTSLASEKQQQFKVLRGHMRFALHAHLPTTAQYVTILRHPVERIASYYHYVRQSPFHRFYHDAQQMPLEQFVANIPDWNLDNGHTRCLSDIGHFELEHCSAESLTSAKANLRKMTVVGLTERFDEMLILLKRQFSWKWPVYFKQNASKRDGTHRAISPAAFEMIAEKNALDMALYQEAKMLVEERLRHETLAFKGELLLFRWLNRGFRTYHPHYYAITRRFIRDDAQK